MDHHQHQLPASNFSSPSSETSESDTLPKIHSFSSITQLYFKFNKNTSLPKQQPPKQLEQEYGHQRLSSTHSISSSYSNQSNQYSLLPINTVSANNRLHIPNHHSLLPLPLNTPTIAAQQTRTLHHQSSLPRFAQPQLKLRPTLTSTSQSTNTLTTTPLTISKKLSSIYKLDKLDSSTEITTSHPSYIPQKSNSLTLALGYHAPQSYYLPPRSRSPSDASCSCLPSPVSDLNPSTSASSRSSSKAPATTVHLDSAPSTQPIHVIVRLRDQTKPNPTGHTDLVAFDNETITLRIPVSMTNTNQQVNSYEFKVDKVIYPTPNSKLNVKVYERCSIETKLLVPFMNGFNSSLIAYGQTGSGKSFTLGSDHDPSNTDGLIPKTLERLFANLDLEKHDSQAELLVSFIEIYNDEIVDLLLNPPSVAPLDAHATKNQRKVPIKIHEDKLDGTIDLVGCKKLKITHLNQAMSYFNHGLAQRSIGATQMNQNSSRSHAIFTLHLISSCSSPNSTNNSHLIVKKTCSKFQFVDLAGSERINKTKNLLGGDRFKEGIFINAGLHSLGNVISALSNQPSSSLEGSSSNNGKKKNHIPYRESKLTRLMKDCLGGNSKTILISCISQNAQDLNESLNTLRYAIRAKKIENVSQKMTRVISTPTAVPMSRASSGKGSSHTSTGAGKSRVPTVSGPRLLKVASSPTLGTTTVATRPTPGGRREIKKPMVMMKHELSKIMALKGIVTKGASAAAQQTDEDDPLCPAVYLANQVHKFFLLNSNHIQLHGPLTRPLKLDAQLVTILQSHFSPEVPPSPLRITQLMAPPPPLLYSSPGPAASAAAATDSPIALEDPFLRFLLDLNTILCNSSSPSSSSRPSLLPSRIKPPLSLM